jgi:hypothetical protein
MFTNLYDNPALKYMKTLLFMLQFQQYNLKESHMEHIEECYFLLHVLTCTFAIPNPPPAFHARACLKAS